MITSISISMLVAGLGFVTRNWCMVCGTGGGVVQ